MHLLLLILVGRLQLGELLAPYRLMSNMGRWSEIQIFLISQGFCFYSAISGPYAMLTLFGRLKY